jgi:hypothetical protein
MNFCLLLILIDSFTVIPRNITKRSSCITFSVNSFLLRFSGLPLVSLNGLMHVLDCLKLALSDLTTEYGLLYLVVLLFRYLNLGLFLATHLQSRPQTHLMMLAILACPLENSQGQGEIVLGLATATFTDWVVWVVRRYQEVQPATL